MGWWLWLRSLFRRRPQLQRQVAYSAVVLNRPEELAAQLAEYTAPLLAQGWVMHNRPPAGRPPERLPHHYTLTLGPLPQNLRPLLGQQVSLQATHWGQSDKALAVRVECELRRLDDGPPHVTVAIGPEGRPADSNQICDWTPLPRPIPLTGTVCEIERPL
jgi:hypothetical protein